jgi:hypothetical protein
MGLLSKLKQVVSGAGDIGQDIINETKSAGNWIDRTIRQDIPGGWVGAALIAAGAYYSPEIGAWITPEGTAIAGTEAGITAGAETFTAEQVVAQQAAAAAAAEQAAATAAAEVAAQNAAYDQAMQDLAKNYVSPQFATATAAQGMTFKQGLDAVRAGLLVNALTGDPLGLSDVGAGGGPSFAQTGFEQVPIPTDWKSPEYTNTPVQNVSFEDLFPGVSLQGTQWQNLPQSQTFNELFATGQQQTPMGMPVNINQIVGSILGQNATS